MTDEITITSLDVVALRDGMYPNGTMRKRGDKFKVTDEKHISKRWMARKGTPQYDDFMRALAQDDSATRDAINGERVSSGGIAEQLSIALEENRSLKAQVAELKAELELAREANPAPAKVETVTPAEKEEAIENEASKPVRRRRTKA